MAAIVEKKEEPKKSDDSWMEILADLDYLQTAIDRVQEDQDDNKMRISYHKESVSQFLDCRSENDFLNSIFNINLSEFGFQSFSEFEEGYEEKLQEKIRVHKEAAEEGRRKENKSFIELLQTLNQSDEGRGVFNDIKATATHVGTGLSRFLVEYLMFFSESELETIETKIQAVKNVIQSESLEGNSVIIDMFISVLEYISKEMAIYKRKQGTKKGVIKKENVSLYSKSENDLLGMIVFEVFNFEIAFCRPIFPTLTDKKVVLLVTGKYIETLLASKLNHISSYMNKLETEVASTQDHDTTRKNLKEKLNAGIENKYWRKLELQLRN